MKIRKPGDGTGNIPRADKKSTATHIAVQKSGSFQPLLQENQARYTQEELKQMMDNITGLGERLSRQPNLHTLISYKKAVAEFLNIVTDFSFEFQKQNYFDRKWGRYNVYALLKKVDTKLETLTKQILNQESDNLLAVSLVDEIRGLLMDLLV